jgi:plasmid replication initiation protein
MSKKKKEVIKHSAAIQTSNNINLLQRRAWNVLLANAFDDLLKSEDVYSITIKDLCDYLKYNSKDEKHIKESLRALINTTIEWNLLNKDNDNEWNATSLLANVKIVNGVCYYSFGGLFRKQLYNPTIYARINLTLQNNFKSKHTLALYELFVDYYRIKDVYGETPYIEIEIFRKLVGLTTEEYKKFAILNRDVIKKSLKEINKKSDLSVKVVYKRQERRVIAIKFLIERNPNNTVEIKSTAKIHNTQPSLPVPELELANQELFEILTSEFGISNDTAIEFLKTQDEFYLEEIFEHVREKIKEGKVKDISGYTIAAIKKDFRTKKTKYEIEKEKEAERKKQAKKEKQLLEKLKQDFDEHYKIQTEKALKELSKSEKANQIKAFEKEHIANSDRYTKRFYKEGGINNALIKALFRAYISDKILPPEDRDFIEYAKAKGYEIEKAKDDKYKFVKSPEYF